MEVWKKANKNILGACQSLIETAYNRPNHLLDSELQRQLQTEWKRKTRRGSPRRELLL